MADMIISRLYAKHLKCGFIETLSTLRPIDATLDELYEILYQRDRSQLMTLVGVITDPELDTPRVIATATGVRLLPFYHGGRKAVLIEDVAVHPDFQRQGYGRQMVEHLIAEARAANCYKVVLNCTTAVRPFYESMGFLPHEQQMRLSFL